VIERDQRHFSAYLDRGKLWIQERKYQAAVIDLSEALGLDPSSAEAMIHRGDAYSRLKMPVAALADYGKVIRLNPKDALGYAMRGRLHLGLKRFKEAAEDLEAAVRLERNAETRRVYESWLGEVRRAGNP